ncbi:hypothetical protein CKF54_06640, partial [Psittacicella hinzii]
MNKIFNLKYSKTKKQLVVVSELATNADVGSTSSAKETKEVKAPNAKDVNLALSPLAKSSVIAAGLASSLSLVGNAQADAARTGMDVISGTVNVVTNGLVTEITNSANAIINWQTFNINENEIVKFIQQSTDSAVLNRVIGGQISQILGTLQSNGKVFIVNPAGIVFGENSVVDVGSLVASTLDITNEDFLNGNYVFNQDKDQAIAQILSQGMIKVNDDGSLALIGGQVVNTGVLKAENGSVFLLAGKSITIQDLDNPLISYKVTAENKAVNLGEIISKRATLLGNKVANGYTSASEFADIMSNYATSATNAKISADGEIVLYGASVSDEVQTTAQTDTEVTGTKNSLVVNNGTLNSSNTAGKAGTIKVLGDEVVLGSNSDINASGATGGDVYVGGDFKGNGSVKLANNTTVETGSKINVSGVNDAGNIAVWGNYAYVSGEFSATSVNGNGGFLETSGKYISIADDISVNTSSEKGVSYYGNWLIDPTDLTIYNSSSTSSNTYTGWYQGKNGYAGSSLSDTVINNQLKSTSVTILTDGNVTITGAYLYTLAGNNNYLTIYTSGGTYKVENSTFNFAGNGTLSLIGMGNFSMNNSSIEAYSLVLGSYEQVYNESQKYWLNISDSYIHLRGNTTSYIRANAYASSSINNTTIDAENSTLSIKYSENFTFNGTNITAAEVDLYPIEGATDVGGVTTTFVNSSVNVSKSFNLNNTRSALNVSNSSINGSDTATVTTNVKNINISDNSTITGNTVALTTVDGSINVANSSVTSASNTSLVAVGGDIAFDGATIGVTDGNISLNASNNVTLSETVTLEMSDSSNISVYGGNNAKVENVSLTADNINVSGGNVTVENSTLNATTDTSLTANNALTLDDSTVIAANNVSVCSTNGTVDIANTTINAGDSVVLSAKEDLSLDNHTYVNATSGDVDLTSSEGNVSVVGTNITASEGNVSLSAYSNLTVENSNISAKKGLALVSETENVSLVSGTSSTYSLGEGANLTVSAGKTATVEGLTGDLGNVDINGTDVALSNNNLSLSGDLAVNAANSASLSNNTISADDINVTTTSGDLTVADSNLTSVNDTVLNAGGDLEVANTTATSTSGDLTLSGSNVTLGDGTILTANETDGDVAITATDGTASLEGTNVTANNVTLTSTTGDLVANNSNISAVKPLNFTSTEGNVTLTDTSIKTDGDLTVTAGKNATISGENSTITLGSDGSANLTVTAGENATVENVKGTVNKAEVTAGNDVSVANTSLNATTLTLDAANGNLTTTDSSFNVTENATLTAGEAVTLNNTTVNATTGLDVEGKSVELNNGTNLISDSDINVVATEGDLNATGSNITSNEGSVTVSSASNLTLENSNISASKDVNVTAEGVANLNATNVSAETGNVTVSGTEGLHLNNGTNISASGEVNLTSTGGSLTTEGTNVTSENGNVSLFAKDDLTVDNSNISGKAGILFNASEGSLTIGNSTLNTTGNLSFEAGKDISLSDLDLNVTDFNLQANGNASLANTSVNATDISVSGTNVNVTNGSILTATECVSLTATDGSVNVLDSNLTAQNGSVAIQATDDVTIDNSNISGATGVTINAENGTADI